MESFIIDSFVALLIFTLVTSAPTPVEDFNDPQKDGRFQFIYHQNHHLFMAVDNSSCYFARVRDDLQYWMDDDHRHMAEEAMETMIIKFPAYSHLTTLDEMRAVFKDLLADFHCIDKDVYLFLVPEGVVPGDATATVPASSVPSHSTSASSHHNFNIFAWLNAPLLPAEAFGAGLTALAANIFGR